MNTSDLKNFAQESRRYLMDVVKKKIEYYLTSDNADIRAKKDLIDDLKKEIADTTKDQVIEKIAYTWFNRFCALRFLDVKQYSLIGVLTPASSEHTQPEILMEAKSGHIKEELGRKESKDQVIALLSGKASSSDPQSDAYKLLLLMACNYYHSIMPFLFEKIDNYTELLMPDDLLSESSIISKTREALSAENCENVEVIGWLYQFYISEKKDEVFAGLKNNKKITPENIPAATQLFTPNWIVRYLVENSLGRLWMLNRPSSTLVSKMEYYIKPETVETDFLKIKGPDEIKICDPACGSGHMLVYAFDLLYLMYEEDGADSNEIPYQILKNNLFGVEIDKRAGELAAFALTMKAREKQRRYFKNPVQPNICVLDNIHFEANEIKEYMHHIGRDLLTEQFQNTLHQFEDAKNFGSLIKPELTDVDNILSMLDKKNVSGHLLLSHSHSKILRLLSCVELLSPVYHIVITNPPYMGSKGMNISLKSFLERAYPNSKSDLMTSFMDRMNDFLLENGYWGMINLPSWMFTSTYENFRSSFLTTQTISTFLHLGRGIFGSDFGSTAFVCKHRKPEPLTSGIYRQLYESHTSVRSVDEIKELFHNREFKKFIFSQDDFSKVPGSPIAYWVSEKIRNVFVSNKKINDLCDTKQGIATGENEKFLRYWFEVSFDRICFDAKDVNEDMFQRKWYPYSKGGAARKWYGNLELVVNWENNGSEIKNFKTEDGKLRSRPQNLNYQFREAATWSLTSFSRLPLCARWRQSGCMFDINGMSAFSGDGLTTPELTALLSSRPAGEFIKIINPTLAFQSGDVGNIPIPSTFPKSIAQLSEKLISISQKDWDSFETSWDYSSNLIIQRKNDSLLSNAINAVLSGFDSDINDTINLETEINRELIKAFHLEDELKPEVEVDEVTLLNNPIFRFGADKEEKKLKELQVLELAKEFISFSVGCMFGRYSLDKEGLILANKGETIQDYLEKNPNSVFVPDEDNVIPILDGDWFVDEISDRFKKFLKVTFGVKNFEENLQFVQEAIGKDIGKYFAKDFYNDHLKMYKKRPIYWMFSSPNGTFNALIYMHRYTPDTVSIVLNGYLREFRTKLTSKRENLERLSNDSNTSARDKTSAVKEIEQLKKMIIELDVYENDILYPLATQRVEIDLDDGVKANYLKFGKAIKPIKGLDKDEE